MFNLGTSMAKLTHKVNHRNVVISIMKERELTRGGSHSGEGRRQSCFSSQTRCPAGLSHCNGLNLRLRGPVSSGPETQASGLSLAEARRALRGNLCPEIANFREQLTPVLLPSEDAKTPPQRL